MTDRDLATAQLIRDAVLAAAGDRVRRVVLHGSRASGTARPSSDFDVLVVVRDPVDDWIGESLRFSSLFDGFPWPVDVQVYGERDYVESAPVPGTLAYPAATRGVLLYEDTEGGTASARPRVDPVG